MAFKKLWDTVQYATSRGAAQTAYEALKTLWGAQCDDAVSSIERDLEALLTHYDFPQTHRPTLSEAHAAVAAFLDLVLVGRDGPWDPSARAWRPG